mgnify:CR=1 FL=1
MGHKGKETQTEERQFIVSLYEKEKSYSEIADIVERIPRRKSHISKKNKKLRCKHMSVKILISGIRYYLTLMAEY